MPFFSSRDPQLSSNTKRKSRRPEGVSRRRKRELGFEPLEDRRVMSAESPVQNWQLYGINLQSTNYSSATTEGQLAVLANELYWQALMSSYANSDVEMNVNGIPTDPLLNNQWHLINSGQQVGNPDYQPIFAIPGEDINVGSVWNDNIFGNGVIVAVIDSGVQTSHPDLAGNIHPTLSLDALDGDDDANPNLFFPINAHGTAVAGLIAAVANNGEGGTGVAPGAQIVPIRLIDAGQTEQAFIDTFRYVLDNGIDITNNSWGPGVSRGIVGPTDGELLALRDSILFGRDGLGVIHIFSSGNDAGTPLDTGFTTIGNLDSSTYNGWVTSRYTIGVTGVDHDGFYNNIDGTIFSYAETGPNVLVAAPTGSNFGANIINDTGLGSGIWTTDTLGDTGFNESGYIDDRDFYEDTDYTSRFNGTSAAAPLVSGVVALMLEANPNLSWRDVQEILVRSARQNAEYDVPIVTGVGSTQNTWIVNQMDLFHDPDDWDPSIDPFLQTLAPTLDPTIPGSFAGAGPTATAVGSSNNHYNPRGISLTNGAGYTVSQGIGVYGEEIGYAHGVVDAELAVQLAQQWSTKNQNLPGELTYTSFVNPQAGFQFPLPAREQGSQESGYQVVPGGLGGQAGFIGYWNEYFVDDPDFSQVFNPRGGYIELAVPDNNTMNIENVEIKINVTGNESEFLQNVRVVLVSPDGTHHEMNDFFIQDAGVIRSPMNITQDIFSAKRESGALAGLTNDTTPDGPMVATFSSNRSWGERSDSKYLFDPTTKEPISTTLQQGWQLHFENYSSSAFEVQAIEVAWHGSPVAANTYRLQGVVGVDDNQDSDFNFSRVQGQTLDIDGDASTMRYGEFANTIDFTHESMASNVTVVVRRASDNVVVDQFVTGADGNYYFDLVPDDYIISVEDPEGRLALEDTLSNPDVLQHYRTEWEISSDFFKIWEYDQNLEVAVDANGVPLSFGGVTTEYHVKDINFLLDPGAPVAPQVQFSGVVSADMNSDGIFNGTDVNVPGITVYADVNRNGQLDPGEISTQTNANGQYNLTVPNSINTVINVGVVAPPNWVFSDPTTGFEPLFVEPGDVFTGINFDLTPPAGTNAGNGTNQPGYLFGSVYEDLNTNGSRQAAEQGVAGLQVYVDANNNGTYEVGERTTTTNTNGAFVFANMPAGTHRVRIVTAVPLVPINPAPGNARVAILSGGGSVTGLEFGIGNTANQDFGDLPAAYGTAVSNAAHGKSNYYLGAKWDAELVPQSSANANGDDLIGGDEDGVIVTPLMPGTSATATVTASRHGGVLQAWVDFNGDFDFNDPGERIFTNVTLAAGSNTLTFQVPAALAGASSATGGVIYARFRYGEYGINSPSGNAVVGEVEDYILAKDPSSLPAVIEHGPDFDEDGDIDGRDFLTWQRNHGATNATAAQGDANGDGVVGYNDLVLWRSYYGTTVGSFSAFTAGDSDDELAAVVAEDNSFSDQVAAVIADSEELPEDGTLVEALLIIDTYNDESFTSVTEASAASSTLVGPGQSAPNFDLLFASEDESSSDDSTVAVDELDSAFADSSDLVDLGVAIRDSSRDRSSSASYLSSEEAESEEDEAFALAFEGNDWLQF